MVETPPLNSILPSVTLIKLGGSVITEKEKSESLREDVLHRLVTELARVVQEQPNRLFILGHGHGSFAHVPAAKYQTAHGFQDESSAYGAAVVLERVSYLHSRVLSVLVEAKLPAFSWRPTNAVVLTEGVLDAGFPNSLFVALEKKLLPVTCGDVLLDSQKGSHIWSTEKVFFFMRQQLLQRGYVVDRMVYVTDVQGVLGKNNEVIPLVTQENWSQVKQFVGEAKGVDVTGGMVHKLETCLEMAGQGTTSYIVSGLEENNLYAALSGDEWVGTKVE